ncbi:hypothetical protein [Paenibacillus sp. N3.4]|uniref:hypothetical protein n=1 Tax=Paenibacillus sp. N3.4 TaxID=2603222 RepID=UPI0011CA3934|nr:hypothetical protein [Paenibacillus sp. N3.4]TXK83893.1 hypothetical protein FU659_11595 [Paenibacillus sp. N3.4]
MKIRNGKTVRKQVKLTVHALRKVAVIMLPFYQKLAADRSYSARWAKAVREADLDTLEKMLRSVIGSVPLASFGTNGIGYFIGFPLPKPLDVITNATSIRPGQVQFTFSGAINRSIAKAVVPLYREIANNAGYAALLVKAINANNKPFLNRLLRSTVTTRRFTSLEIAYSGMFLGFKYPSSKYVYYNEVFLEFMR